MAAGVRGDIRLALNLVQTGANDLGTPKLPIQIEKLLSLVPGTSETNQANILFSDTRMLAASATENLDLAGVLTNAFGATITAAEIVLIFISAAAANVNDVQITRPAANGFIGPFLATGDGLAVRPGEWLPLVSQSGWAVTAATGDLLTITNGGAGTGVTYDIIIVGRTVAA